MSNESDKLDTSPDSLQNHLKAKSRQRRRNIQRAAGAQSASIVGRNDLMPHLELVRYRIADLKMPAQKVRKQDLAHIDETAASIKLLGFCAPALVNGDLVPIDGLTRIEALKLLGMTEVTCIRIDHLDSSMQRMLRLALNRLQEKGIWDFDELKVEMKELIRLDLPIEITGFTSIEIDQIVLDENVGSAEIGPLAPPPDAIAISEVGYFYHLGSHRVLCGDATSQEVVSRLMSGLRCAAVLTDPPYNVPISGHVTRGENHREFVMGSSEMSREQYKDFTIGWMERARGILVSGGVLASFIDWRGLATILGAAEHLWLALINLVVWGKTNAGMGSLYRSQHELLPIFRVGGGPVVNNVKLGRTGRWRSNLWSYAGASSIGSEARKGLEYHPTVKPVPMLSDALLDFTNRGDIVVDPFLGSGSTLMAAEKTGRRCFGLELDPLYVDVIIRRYEKATGKAAVLEGTGETFLQVAERRRSESTTKSAGI